MKQNHVTLADLKELLSLEYLEYWTILNIIEGKVGMETIYNYILFSLPTEELKSLVERLTIIECVTFTEDEYDTIRKLRD